MQPENASETLTLEHGAGGAASLELIERVIRPRLGGSSDLADAALLDIEGPLLFTHDGYVVDPLFFPGGDIGRLAVFGTCNDLAVCGGRPRALSLGLVIEEGFGRRDLERVLDSIASAAREAAVEVVTGDTKVVPAGRGGGLYLAASGIGTKMFPGPLGPAQLRPGDRLLVSGPLGAHGVAVLAARERLPVGAGVSSDCALLGPLCELLFPMGERLRVMRDATRGGLAAVANELCRGTPCGILLDESALPLDPDVAAACEILGLDPLEVANEGVLVAIVAGECAEAACSVLRSSRLGRAAAIVGTVTDEWPGRVMLATRAGGRRLVDLPQGLLLPRIC